MDLTPLTHAADRTSIRNASSAAAGADAPGIVLAIGLASAVLLYCSARAFGKSYSEAFFCSPFFVGAVVGLLGPRRPIRNSLYTLLAALVLGVVDAAGGRRLRPVLAAAGRSRDDPGRAVRVDDSAATSTIAGVASAPRRMLVLAGVGWQVIDGRLDDPAHHPLHHATSTT